MGVKFFSIGWTAYLGIIQKCLSLINVKPDFIFAPVRGGLIPAVIASHNLQVKMYTMEPNSLDKTLHPYSFNKIKRKKPTVLLIDDISDTGTTLKKCVSYLTGLGYVVTTCTLTKKASTKLHPNICGTVVPENRWVIFPYENQDNEK